MATRVTVGKLAVGVGKLAEELRGHGVLLENIQSQFQVVLEAVTGSRQSLEAKMDALEARLGDRIAVLEDVVRKNSEDIEGLRVEVERLRFDFDQRQERRDIEALERRVSAIESHLGIRSSKGARTARPTRIRR